MGVKKSTSSSGVVDVDVDVVVGVFCLLPISSNLYTDLTDSPSQ